MFIEFSNFNIKLIILIIFPLFRRIEDFVKNAYLTDNNYLFKMFRYFSSYIFSFILLLIMRRRNKKSIIINSLKIQKEIETIPTINQTFIINEIDELQQKNQKKKKIKSVFFLIFLSIFNCWCYLYRLLFENEKYGFTKQSIGILFDIAEYIILSHLILKQKLYLHNFVSMGIIAFILLILFIITIFHMNGKDILYSFIYYLFYSFFFSFLDVLEKKYMNDFYNSPYFIMCLIGIINIIGLLIYDLFAYYLNRDKSGIIIGFINNVNSLSNVFLFILDIIIEFIWNLGIILTIYYFNPCHFFISEYISEYVYYIENATKSHDEFYSIINIIIFSFSYFINIFCCLVFNEVLILNFCKLDFNTKKRIEERMKIDEKVIKDDKDITTESEDNIS